jgi:carbon-monoxide dehydrogenase large subunit
MIGDNVPRVEDERLLRGQGCFVDDMSFEDRLEAAFVRSPFAHARIVSIDAGAALALPGVVAVLTGADAAELEPMVFDIAKIIPDAVREATDPQVRIHPLPALPADRVTFFGQPVAMVVARDRYVAEDARELVQVDYEPLDAVVDAEEALRPGAPLVEPTWADNVAVSFRYEQGAVTEAFEGAAAVVEETFRLQRQHASPIETRGVAASLDADGALRVWSSTQTPYLLQSFLGRWLPQPPEVIHVAAPDVGGSFGSKHSCYPEDLLVPWAALRLGSAVKWTEDRAENLAASTHGRDQVHRIALAADADGRILAVRDSAVMNAGACNLLGLVVPYNTFTHLLGPYAIEALEFDIRVVLTNTGIVAPYRGAGRPEAVFALERAIDRLARALELDPAELRSRNLIPPEQLPYKTGLVYRDGNESIYDSGDYPELLRRVRELVDLERFAPLASERRRLGVGYACYTEGTGVGPFESACVRIERSGRVTVLTGASSQGQGHRTTLAQIAAVTLGIPLEDVDVVEGDSAALAQGFGTIASRTLVVAGNAIAEAATALREQLLELTARGEEVSEAGLSASTMYRPGPVTWAAGVHAAVVAVDVPTGVVEVLRFVVAHDCGRVVNPAIADGQVVGGVMQGIGGALYEEIVYDESGQLLTGSFMDYALPTAAEMPEFALAHVDVPSPLNALGVKGLGEGGAIGPPAAIANAVEDALADLGVVVRTCPLSPSKVRELVRDAKVNTVDSAL